MDNYALGGPLTGTQYWAQQLKQHSQTPTNAPNQLNPHIPSFQPNGLELQHYQTQHLPPTPPPANQAPPADMVQLRNMMIGSHFSYTKDVAGLERKTQQNIDDIKSIQSQFEQLKRQVEAQRQQGGIVALRSRAEQNVTPTPDFFENFSKEVIAEEYLGEALDYERAAMKLREEAEKMLGDAGFRRLVPSKLVNAPCELNGMKAKIDFACCGEVFCSIQDMLMHMEQLHGLSHSELNDPYSEEEKREDGGDTTDETPTHVPPRRSKPVLQDTRPHAVEIKNPGDPEAQTTNNNNKANDESDTSDASEDKLNPRNAQPTGKEWQPLAIKQMPPTKPVAASNTETFTFDFIQANFEGNEWSPGFYFIHHNTILPTKSYWIIEETFEPFLPSAPGQHGAKLTAFFNNTPGELDSGPDEENYIDVPVFINPKNKARGEYVYYGNYSQHRFSDKLDHDHLMQYVSQEIRAHHAQELASVGRPQWVTKELMEHFWPMPKYSGPLPTDSKVATPATAATEQTGVSYAPEKQVKRALLAYAEELKEWEVESAMRVSHLTEKHLMDAFAHADADAEPGLRLWFEYLQFERYDEEFYKFLVEVKKEPKLIVPLPGHDSLTQRKLPVGGKMVKPKNGIETVRPPPAPASTSTAKPATFSDQWTGMQETEELKPEDSVSVANGRSNHRLFAALIDGTASKDSSVAKTVIKSSTKTHTGGSRPWEKTGKDTPSSRNPPNLPRTEPKSEAKDSAVVNVPEGDMNVAKKLREEFKHCKADKFGKGW